MDENNCKSQRGSGYIMVLPVYMAWLTNKVKLFNYFPDRFVGFFTLSG